MISTGEVIMNETSPTSPRHNRPIYAVKVMTSFGYEILLIRGCWFQSLDVNKPWRQIPLTADRLVFLVFILFFSWLPQGNTKRRNFVQIEPRYWKKFWGSQWQNNGTNAYNECLGNFPEHVLLMQPSKTTLNLPSSSLHLCSPLKEIRRVKIHHHFTSFSK